MSARFRLRELAPATGILFLFASVSDRNARGKKLTLL